MTITRQRLERVFGLSAGTASESARLSKQEFVRSQDHLAPAREGASGRRMTAWEALQYFGFEKLEEAFAFGSAIIVSNAEEPAETLRKRRELLVLEPRDLARTAKVSAHDIEIAEDPKQTSSIRLLERIAQALALDELRISVRERSRSMSLWRLGLGRSEPRGPNLHQALFWLLQKQLGWRKSSRFSLNGCTETLTFVKLDLKPTRGTVIKLILLGSLATD